MRILCTGGAGFIGSHLVDRLVEQGHRVIVFDNFFTGNPDNFSDATKTRNPALLEVVRGDVCDPFHFEVDQVYHLACPASPVHYQRNPARTIKTAALGTLNALECARDVGARILIASTSEVYGDPEIHPQPEEYWGNVNTLGPRSCYDEGKRAGEALAHCYAAQYKVEVRIARIFNTYGPRMDVDDGRVVSNFITQALRGEALTLYGSGEQTRSFCYVDDTVEALMRLMAEPEALLWREIPVNIGNPGEFTMRQLADLVRGMIPGTPDPVHEPLPRDDPSRRRPDITRARELLAWEPHISLAEGLQRTITDFAHRLSRPA